jgi:hypothetical protein
LVDIGNDGIARVIQGGDPWAPAACCLIREKTGIEEQRSRERALDDDSQPTY